jgi:tetratricopeptide (TPR) repeat protein
VAEIVPTSPIPHLNLASWYADIGDYDAAIAAAQKAMEIHPGIFGVRAVLARISLYRGDPARALELIADETQLTFKQVVTSIAQYELGDRAAADDVLDQMIADHQEDWAYFIAMVYAWRDDNDTAFAWLDRAIDENQNMNALKTDAFFKGLYSDPRWEQTLARVGLAESQVGSIPF